FVCVNWRIHVIFWQKVDKDKSWAGLTLTYNLKVIISIHHHNNNIAIIFLFPCPYSMHKLPSFSNQDFSQIFLRIFAKVYSVRFNKWCFFFFEYRLLLYLPCNKKK